jgi:micrococcal nuclease
MPKNKLNSEQQFIRNLLIGFFSALFIVFVLAMIALFQTLTTYPSVPDLPRVTIQSCYDGDTCTTTEGEKIRLACIDTPELRGKKADPIPAKAVRDYLNDLVAGSTVTIRRITKDRYGRTVAELSKGPMNIGEHLVEKDLARIYERYASQCEWSMNKI